MPAIVGSISITSIGNSSVLNVGDVQSMCPVSYAKTYAGAGSFNTGDHINVQNGYSMTYTYDADNNDQNVVANN
ncbi:spore germination protein [Fictibacillus aquaticus]|uniref:Spore gernimation protein GerPA n=1 Tax=Fictibacillus aquaticus TaxID=2021314 RepID=A0A235F5H8_9BACL|nr:spore germination protein [Fictibacillus aquaticus]OYD56499.1 spore gernimation protein GerPA [Fictibacillus aquaticus]